jgi:hypothetical protein
MGNPITDILRICAIGKLPMHLCLLECDVQAASPIQDSGNDLMAFRGEVLRGVQVKRI